MAEFGVCGFALLPSDSRVPLWPDRLTGSITHTAGFCAAAVAEKSRFRSVGIDAESVHEVSARLWPKICTTDEMAQLRGLHETEAQRRAALIYSAKEAFYKCQFIVSGQWLNFQDVEIGLDPAAGPSRFTAKQKAPPGAGQLDALQLSGHFRYQDGIVVTFVGWTRGNDI